MHESDEVTLNSNSSITDWSNASLPPLYPLPLGLPVGFAENIIPDCPGNVRKFLCIYTGCFVRPVKSNFD